jgi:predicted glycogen debranching enzyme
MCVREDGMKLIVRRDEILDLQDSMKMEYLLTNGQGGFASGTLIDCHNRKYHGLLNLPVLPYGEGINFLSKVETVAGIENKFFRLSTNKFPGVYEPQGHKYIDSIEINHSPVTFYRLGETEIKKTIVMPKGEQTVLICWEITASPKKVLLKFSPFLAYRSIHGLMHENMNLRPRPFPEKNGFKIDPYEGLPPLYIQLSRGNEFFPSPMWSRNFEYMKELNRGYDYQEDLFSPGVFEITLKKGQNVILRASLKPAEKDIQSEWDNEEERVKELESRYEKQPEPLRTLKTSADHYILTYPNGEKGICAGYHWFGEWGRDTMISLAGLTLCTNRAQDALDILSKYTKYEKDGLLPNYFTAEGGNAYNSIDASLLFIRAVQQYLDATEDSDAVIKNFLPAMVRIIMAFLEKRVPAAGINDKGFIEAGDPGTNLTWMDARVDGKPVTPRHGCAVEINALWYNALCFLAHAFKKQLEAGFKQKIELQIALYEKNFLPAFWNEEQKCLFDVYRNDNDRDGSIRPNQLFASGLPYSCVPKERIREIIETVKCHLVTPFGLRTLSPDHPDYQAEYHGSPANRDAAYHQGVVWPWLTGIFMDTLLKAEEKKSVKTYLEETFSPLWEIHLAQYCLQHISEIFNPVPPYTPKGACAQAWSLAEAIRVIDTLRKVPAKRGRQ